MHETISEAVRSQGLYLSNFYYMETCKSSNKARTDANLYASAYNDCYPLQHAHSDNDFDKYTFSQSYVIREDSEGGFNNCIFQYYLRDYRADSWEMNTPKNIYRKSSWR
jgi:hypothetical protein